MSQPVNTGRVMLQEIIDGIEDIEVLRDALTGVVDVCLAAELGPQKNFHPQLIYKKLMEVVQPPPDKLLQAILLHEFFPNEPAFTDAQRAGAERAIQRMVANGLITPQPPAAPEPEPEPEPAPEPPPEEPTP